MKEGCILQSWRLRLKVAAVLFYDQVSAHSFWSQPFEVGAILHSLSAEEEMEAQGGAVSCSVPHREE